MSDDKHTVAAQMAGEWWAGRLHERYADKREQFANAVAARIDQELRGNCYWDWWGNKVGGPGRALRRLAMMRRHTLSRLRADWDNPTRSATA